MLESLAETQRAKVSISIQDVRKPSQLAELDGLIIPGGESTTLSVFLRQNDFEQALKSFVFNEKKPGFVWGTCAGLILLSDQLDGQKQGGQITVRNWEHDTPLSCSPCLPPPPPFLLHLF